MEIDDIVKKLQEHEDLIATMWDTTDKLRVSDLVQPINNYGIYTAICVSTYDVWKQNAVQYFSPILHKPTIPIEGLPWASAISSFGGFDDCGASWVPPAGSTIIVAFENGMNGAGYYIGTTWTRDRAPGALNYFGYPIIEYNDIYAGKRNGYLCGANDGSQVMPPWNTESYNGFDIDSIEQIISDPNILKRTTTPNIYGFKTPEKHMMKMVDGDPSCNRKWKRLEIMSGNGNWMCFKDDHLHYGGQWAHPACANFAKDGDTSCIQGVPNPEAFSYQDFTRFPLAGSISDLFNSNYDDNPVIAKSEEVGCSTDDRSTIIGGEPESQINPDSQIGRNPFFKQQSECRPYKGPQTPQNNKCDLPQTGIQFLSISGHSFVMDDSVHQPRGNMEWDRSIRAFDFGCDDKFVGRSYWKSTTGHLIELNDIERVGTNTDKVRADNNGVKIKSALGNQIFLCDAVDGLNCTDAASSKQGVKINSTSQHEIFLCDGGNLREYPCRRDGAVPEPKATAAYMQLRTGYGLSIRMDDSSDQNKTLGQYISITAPQKTIENGSRPHQITLREGFEGVEESGYIQIRSGGNLFLYAEENALEYVKGHKMNYVATNRFDYTEQTFYHKGKGNHVIQFDEKIYLLAGRDYPPIPPDEAENPPPENVLQIDLNQATDDATATDPDQCIPGVFPVLVLVNGCVRASDRVYASCSNSASGIGLGALNITDNCLPGEDLCSGGLPLEGD